MRPIQEGTADPLLEAEKIAVATKEALKQKIVQSASKEFEAWTIPAKLHIDPNDSEDVVCLDLQPFYRGYAIFRVDRLRKDP